MYFHNFFLIQVSVLLVEVEEARGNQVVREDLSSAVSSSSEVQGSRQVAFRSVQELQQQNQNLLAQIRDLEEQRERDQNQAKSARYWPCDLGSGIWTTGINTHIFILEKIFYVHCPAILQWRYEDQ